MPEKIRVALDLSLVGRGVWNGSIAGMSRTVDNLARRLAVREDCQLFFTAGHTAFWNKECEERWRNLEFSLKFWEADTALSGQPFPHRALHKSGWRAALQAKHGQVDKMTSTLQLLGEESAMLVGNADIFHANFIPLPHREMKSQKTQRFFTLHDLIPIFYPEFFDHPGPDLFRRSLEMINDDDWIICGSESAKNDICQYLEFPPERVFVTYWGADERLFHENAIEDEREQVKCKFGIESAYILCSCTWEPRKNLDRLMQCFERLVKKHDLGDVCLVLVGKAGWKTEAAQRALAALPDDVRKNVIVTGYISDDDLAALYRGALFFIYPSLYEGFGLPVLEAMQSGTPVITSNTSSMPEVIGSAGLLVDPTSVEDMTEKMLQLCQSAELRRELAEKSVKRARTFSWDRCAEDTVAAYRAALN